MALLARFPRVSAWLVTLALIGLTTLGALQGLRALEPVASESLEHVHGVIIAMRGESTFAVQVSGRSDAVIWFRIAPGSSISLAHLERHLHERAATDVYYLEQPSGQRHELPLAWIAD